MYRMQPQIPRGFWLDGTNTICESRMTAHKGNGVGGKGSSQKGGVVQPTRRNDLRISVELVSVGGDTHGKIAMPIPDDCQLTVGEVAKQIQHRAMDLGVSEVRFLEVVGEAGGRLFPQDRFFVMWKCNDGLVAVCR